MKHFISRITVLALSFLMSVAALAGPGWIAPTGGAVLSKAISVPLTNNDGEQYQSILVAAGASNFLTPVNATECGGTTSDDVIDWGIAVDLADPNYDVMYSGILAAIHGQTTATAQPYKIDFYVDRCIAFSPVGANYTLYVQVVSELKLSTN